MRPWAASCGCTGRTSRPSTTSTARRTACARAQPVVRTPAARVAEARGSRPQHCRPAPCCLPPPGPAWARPSCPAGGFRRCPRRPARLQRAQAAPAPCQTPSVQHAPVLACAAVQRLLGPAAAERSAAANTPAAMHRSADGLAEALGPAGRRVSPACACRALSQDTGRSGRPGACSNHHQSALLALQPTILVQCTLHW